MSIHILKPLPRTITRPIALLVLVAWAATMATLVARSYGQSSKTNLATDLARYGSTAVWRGVYYRGEKIGFTVSQTTRTEDGFELQEDGRLQMLLLGQDTAARIHTTARVDGSFTLRGFEFSLDPGTGPIEVKGTVDGPSAANMWRLNLAITSGGVTRTETRDLPEAPVVTQNLSRLLADKRLVPGTHHEWTVLDPATLQSAKVSIRVGDRTIVRANDTVVPAFRVDMDFRGLQTTSWVTDTGEVVREESPLGLITVREPAERAQGLAVSSRMQADLLQAAAVVPQTTERIDEPRDVRRLKLRLDGAPLSVEDVDGVGQRIDGNVIELTDPRMLEASAADPRAREYLAAEALIESDDPLIRAEAEQAVRGAARRPRSGRAAHALRQRVARQEANGQLAVSARGSAHEGRRLQRAHGALRCHGALDRHPRADRRRARVHARSVLLPRMARGVHHRAAWSRFVAASRSDAQSVSG